MIRHHLHHGILEIEPGDTLKREDIETLTRVVDDYLATHEKLHGLLIYTKHFPVWEDFHTMVRHFTFVKDHHRRIGKVALVTDSPVATIAPLVGHFTQAEVKKLGYSEREQALKWLG